MRRIAIAALMCFPAAIFSSPLVVDGVVYFASTDGNLYALE